MNFGQALEQLKAGHRVRRLGWNGPDQYLYLVAGSNFKVNREPLLSMFDEGHDMTYQAHIDMITQQGSAVPWLASQTDVLAEDWTIKVMPDLGTDRAAGDPDFREVDDETSRA